MSERGSRRLNGRDACRLSRCDIDDIQARPSVPQPGHHQSLVVPSERVWMPHPLVQPHTKQVDEAESRHGLYPQKLQSPVAGPAAQVVPESMGGKQRLASKAYELNPPCILFEMEDRNCHEPPFSRCAHAPHARHYGHNVRNRQRVDHRSREERHEMISCRTVLEHGTVEYTCGAEKEVHGSAAGASGEIEVLDRAHARGRAGAQLSVNVAEAQRLGPECTRGRGRQGKFEEGIRREREEISGYRAPNR
jgi:hypothetical protein